MEEATEILANETKALSIFINWIKNHLTWDNLLKLCITVLVILIMWIVYRLVMRGIKKLPAEKMTRHKTALLTTIVKYSFYCLTVMFVLSRFGVKLSAIWGAAGIAGVAIGFASQTSVSNIISGLFVLSEGTIKIGDFISIDEVSGTVDQVNLLSVRIITLDNQVVRIPNSSIINSSLTNYSFLNQRRFVFNVLISYDSDMNLALETLRSAASYCPTVLTNPPPLVWFDGFENSGIKMSAAVWFKSSDLIATKNAMYIAIKKVFDEAGIEISYNRVVLETGKNADEKYV